MTPRPAAILFAVLAGLACAVLPARAPAGDAALPALTVPELKQELRTRDRKLAVTIMAAWCGPCVQELPLLNKLSREFKGRVDFMGVSLDFTPRELTPLLDRLEVGFPFYWVGEKGMAALSIKAVPLLILMDNGREAARIRGAMDEPALRRILTDLAQGRPIKP